MNCNDIEKNSSLQLYGELGAEESAAFEAHLAGCEACRARHEEAAHLHRLLIKCPGPEPTPDLLARCRMSLDEVLDREQLGWRSLLRGWLWNFGAAPATRAVAVVTLIAFGFGLGWTLRPRATALQTSTSGGQASSLDTSDLGRIRSINSVAPDLQSGGVTIQMDAERRVTLQGSLDDPRIRQVLINTVKSYDNPGIRRDTLDALRMNTQDPAVRDALEFALTHDENVGNRLEALRLMQHTECGANTHQCLLNVVEKDPNVGVRAAAIDSLVKHLQEEGSDETVLTALDQLSMSDQNPFVRMRCAAAVRELQEEK
ncbi:MAG: zf-HC2 domain-containing protein [Terriglobia bacterium]